MGEQIHAQIETLSKPESQSESQSETPKPPPPPPPQQDSTKPQSPKPDPNGEQIPNPQPLPPPESSSSHTPHNPSSKIPIRPPKIRKLSNPNPSPNTIPDDSATTTTTTTTTATSSSSSLALSTTTTPRNRRRNSSQSLHSVPRVIKRLSADNEMDLALRHLRTADPLLAPLIDAFPPPQFDSHRPPFISLAKSILYQQLAYKAGTAIYTRFISLLGGEETITPDSILALSSQQLKQIGVSGRKASYLYDLANKYKSGILSDDIVIKMDDRSLFTLLSLVKGIGAWSVHMFMLFSLERPDVLPVSDLGVRKGVQLLYGLEELPRPSRIEQMCEKWRPYRSVGAWYMWRFIEAKGSTSVGSAVALEGSVVQPLQQVEPLQDGDSQQQQHQLQFVEPVNAIGNMG